MKKKVLAVAASLALALGTSFSHGSFFTDVRDTVVHQANPINHVIPTPPQVPQVIVNRLPDSIKGKVQDVNNTVQTVANVPIEASKIPSNVNNLLNRSSDAAGQAGDTMKTIDGTAKVYGALATDASNLVRAIDGDVSHGYRELEAQSPLVASVARLAVASFAAFGVLKVLSKGFSLMRLGHKTSRVQRAN